MAGTDPDTPAFPPPDFEAMTAALARNWWAFALRGLLGVVFGLLAFALPGVTMLSLVMVFAAYALADGVLALIAALREARWGVLVLEGLADIAVGAAAIAWPGLTVLAFVLLVGVWAVLSGGFLLAMALRVGIGHGGVWLLFAGGASVIYGAVLLMAPMLGALVLTWWIGLYALVFGGALLAASLLLRARHRERR
jgi:uncharacterized membrane protein HdeD (DUF308 family)